MRSLVFLLVFLSFFSAAQESFTVYVTRHADKNSGKDPSLSSHGQERAVALSRWLLRQADKPEMVFSTDYNRTRQTAEPISNALGIETQLYQPSASSELVEQLLEEKKSALVIGHSNTVPMLVYMLGGQSESISESEYGTVFALTFEGEDVSTKKSKIVTPVDPQVSDFELDTNRLIIGKRRFDVFRAGELVGYNIHELSVTEEALELTIMQVESTNHISKFWLSEKDLSPLKFVKSGVDERNTDIALNFNQGTVTGHIEAARALYKQQGREQVLKQYTPPVFLLGTLAYVIPAIGLDNLPLNLNVYDPVNSEIKLAQLSVQREVAMTLNNTSHIVNVVTVRGVGQLRKFYFGPRVNNLIGFEIPATQTLFYQVSRL